MVNNRIKNALIAAAAGAFFVLWTLGVWHLGRRTAPIFPDLPVSIKTDTLIVRDTIREKYPVYLTKYVDRVELVQVRDTIRKSDTLFMAVDIEKKEYKGDDYRAVVSGWRPSLDEIAVFPKTVYVQTEVTHTEPQRWRRVGFGLGIGPGVFWNPSSNVQFGVGAVAGVRFNF